MILAQPAQAAWEETSGLVHVGLWKEIVNQILNSLICFFHCQGKMAISPTYALLFFFFCKLCKPDLNCMKTIAKHHKNKHLTWKIKSCACLEVCGPVFLKTKLFH